MMNQATSATTMAMGTPRCTMVVGMMVGSRAASEKMRVCGKPMPIGSFQGARTR
ncbi:hypothetical protein D3C87_2141790 [compost metagenome]